MAFLPLHFFLLICHELVSTHCHLDLNKCSAYRNEVGWAYVQTVQCLLLQASMFSYS
uniref:Uncharacterized protein n=1 Tax=Arundo donax TaxID=35708 RepID=A0A0A9ASS2_ARUDO